MYVLLQCYLIESMLNLSSSTPFSEPAISNHGNSLVCKEDMNAHNKDGGTWGVVHGKVYNLLSFATKFPCGRDKLLACVGKDASSEFDAAGHSDFAHELLEQYLVGTYREAEVRVANTVASALFV